jgi:hypothetical protein
MFFQIKERYLKKETWQTTSKSRKENRREGMAGYSPKNNNPYSPQEYQFFNPFDLDDIEFIDEEDGRE